MTTPRLGAPELVSAQATPETTVNEQIRYVEQGAGHFIFKDRDLATPPGSPADGDCYLVATSGTGTWSGHDGDIAFYLSTAWVFINAVEGMRAYVNDEDIEIVFNGSAWASPAFGSGQLAVAADVWAGASTAKAVTPDALQDAAAPTALTSSASVTPDFNAGLNFTITLAHSGQLENPSNAQAGDSGVIVITQDGTGSRTWSYGTNWKFPGGAPVLSTTAGAIDVLAYFAVTSSSILGVLTKAYSA